MLTNKSLAATVALAGVLMCALNSCDKVPAEPDPGVDPNLEENLIYHFPFSGNAVDEISGQEYDSHGATYLSDRHGKEASAIFFNGFNAWIDLEGNFNIQEGTMSLWIYPCLCKVYNPLFVKKSVETDPPFGQYYFGYTETGTIMSSCRGKWDVETGVAIQANQWYHLTVRWSDAEGMIDVFVNNKKVLSEEYTVDPDAVPGGTESTFLGKILNKSDNGNLPTTVFYKGKLDDIRLYNKWLPDSEIQDLFRE